MRYAETPDLAQLGLPASVLSGFTPADQNAALEAASSLADSYLAARYTLPIISWGSALTRAVAVIAAYDLMSRRGYDPNRPGDENLRLRYEDALRWLQDVAAGRVDPQVQDSSPTISDTGLHAHTTPRRWP
jgi:phage gp36-like protein